MASILMMLSGAVANALSFTGASYMFRAIDKNSVDAERKRHDEAIEKMQKAQTEWSEKRQKRTDYINNKIMKENKAEKRFNDLNTAMQKYFLITGKKLPDLPHEPVLSDFYTPSDDHKYRELAFISTSKVVMGAGFYYYENRKRYR